MDKLLWTTLLLVALTIASIVSLLSTLQHFEIHLIDLDSLEMDLINILAAKFAEEDCYRLLVRLAALHIPLIAAENTSSCRSSIPSWLYSESITQAEESFPSDSKSSIRCFLDSLGSARNSTLLSSLPIRLAAFSCTRRDCMLIGMDRYKLIRELLLFLLEPIRKLLVVMVGALL